MSHRIFVIGCAGLVWSLGCVSVETPGTRVDVGLPVVVSREYSESPPSDTPPYARVLKRVNELQRKVAEKLGEGKWDDVVSRSSEWVEKVRELGGYAGQSQNPKLFRQYSDELLTAVQAVRQAALRRDQAKCAAAFDACDPLLSKFLRAFPLHAAEARASSRDAVSPSSSPRPPVARESSAARDKQIP